MKASIGAESVKVVVRCRPMNEQETAGNHERVVDVYVDRGVVEVRNIKGSETDPPKTFTYDAVYDWNSKQQDLYDETFRPLVDSVLSGFNGTIFAYGQTGTGKTYTMEGIREDPDQRGVIPNSFEHIFNHIARSKNQQYLIRAAYLEIYQEEIRDLLGKDQKKRLELKERPDTGVYVKDLQQFVCKSVNEIQHVMTVGNQNRAVGATNMNLHSSRSHAIFIITIECSEIISDGRGRIRVGKLNLVDLAGSERQSKTGTVGERLKEATKINLSLSALGNVISALVDGKSTHIPYRDSKLTRLLQDSLGGNSKTIMVANIGPASYNYDETLTTLRYANRAKNIKNQPKVNEDPKDAILREYQQEIARLKAQLTQRTGKKKKKKKKREEEDEEEEEEQVDESSILEQEKLFEEERNKILSNQHMIAEEKEKLLAEMKEKENEVKASREAQEKLLSKICTMESKLLSGGKNIIDHTNEQQRALEHRRHEITEQKKKEREMLQLLEKEEESTCEIASTFSSLQGEVEAKTRKLKKLFAKLQAVKQEMQDIQEEFCRDRSDLQHTQNVLTRELKLKALIIENFISPEEKRKILARAFFDDDEDVWKVRPVVKQTGGTLKRPVSSASRRPMSEYARMQAAVDHNPRYKGENIMVVELDPAVRTTREWEGPVVAPRVAAALEAALTPAEDELNIDASQATLNSSQAVKSTRNKKSKGKCWTRDYGEMIHKSKQTMNSFHFEIQEWDSPPHAGAGQLIQLPQTSRPRPKVGDDSGEVITPKCSPTSDSGDESLPIKDTHIVRHNWVDRKNGRFLHDSQCGAFGVRRSCYHYKPQVKRCCWKKRHHLISGGGSRSLERLESSIGSNSGRIWTCCFPCVRSLQSCSVSSSYLPLYANKHIAKNASKRLLLLLANQKGKIGGSFLGHCSTVLQKKLVEWRPNMQPCLYERILWRISRRNLTRIWNVLSDDSEALTQATPIFLSLQRYPNRSPSQMVYSQSRDSYGVTEMEREDLIMAISICCVAVFLYRIISAFAGFLSVLNIFS